MKTQATFEALWNDAEPKLKAHAHRLCKRHEDAQDLLADTRYKAFSRFYAFRHDCPFLPWVYRIMSRRFIDHCRTTDRYKPFDAPLDSSLDHAGSWIGRWDGGIELHCEARDFLSRVPEKYRDLVELMAMGYTADEVSLAAGISAPAVKCRMVRMRDEMSRLHGAA